MHCTFSRSLGRQILDELKTLRTIGGKHPSPLAALYTSLFHGPRCMCRIWFDYVVFFFTKKKKKTSAVCSRLQYRPIPILLASCVIQAQQQCWIYCTSMLDPTCQIRRLTALLPLDGKPSKTSVKDIRQGQPSRTFSHQN